MKSILFAVALFAGSTATDSGISDSELALGGVALGDSESQILGALGQPSRRSDTGEGIALEYPGITVLVGWLEQADPNKQRRVIQLNAIAATACTPSDICPGDPVSKALAAYGQPVKAERESGRFLEYYSNQSSCWIQLGVSDDKVQSISAVCQP